MNKKETAEIRRRFSPDRNNVTLIRGCYVNEKQEIIASFSSSPLMMQHEEAEKYLALFKRTLSGTQGKNLIDIRFSNSQVGTSDEHKLLTALRDTALKDDETVNAFFGRVIESYHTEGNYIILLMHDAYDVPSYGKDGHKDEDSFTQFSYVICTVCPVKMTKPALSYCPADNKFRPSGSDWVIASPSIGFMFPTFDDRAANIYNALYYTGNLSESHKEFTDAVFNTELPVPADVQKQTFGAVLADTLGNECSYDAVQNVRDKICEIITAYDENEDNEGPLRMTKKDMSDVLADCGVPEDRLPVFDERFDAEFGAETKLEPQNIVDVKQLALTTPNVQIKVNPERGDLIKTRVINGVKYVLVRADDGVEVNGLNIKISDDGAK